ncbi:UNVERIFIED_CONTAM: hypothetical protein GTU68_063699, partial [Idotea baltica]|nr:hypothetical protein [Idotea baltica]
GHSLVVYDVSPEAIETLQDAGAAVAPTPADVAKVSDRIVTMLPNSQHVQSCYTGENGIFEGMKAGTLLLDSSTIAPDVSKSVAGLAVKKGAIFLDAPVSGGVNAAKAGTLTFMVGGDKNEFEAAKLILGCMGKNIVYCGDVGSGQAAKICNNMLLAISMIGTAETMNLGIKYFFFCFFVTGGATTRSLPPYMTLGFFRFAMYWFLGLVFHVVFLPSGPHSGSWVLYG